MLNLTRHILYTTTSYLPAIGGAQLHTHQIARRLAAGYTVQVVTLWDSNRTDWLRGTTLNAPIEPKTYNIDGVPVELITLSPAQRQKIRPAVWLYYLVKTAAIRQIAAQFAPKIDPFAGAASLIHNVRIGREPLSFASLAVARRHDIPFVLAPYHHPRWGGWLYRDYHRLYRQADALIALTEAERQTLIGLGVAPERVFVTGNGPNLAGSADGPAFRRRHNLPAAAPIILFVGQKYRYKGIETLAAAAKQVWRRTPEAHFVFLGPPTPFSKRFFAGQSDPRLLDLGAVDLQTKTDALAACTLLCLPSAQESFGGVFTEAWSLGKPVIGADIPAVREVIDDGLNGYLVAPAAGPLAERIGYLLDHPAIAAQLGQAGRQKTEAQYNWEQLARKTEAVYAAVLNGRR